MPSIFPLCRTRIKELHPFKILSLRGFSTRIGDDNTSSPRPLTKLKSAVKFFVKNLFKLREIWYNVGIENSVIMGCRNAFGRNKPTNKNGVCMYRGFGTERPYFKKDR